MNEEKVCICEYIDGCNAHDCPYYILDECFPPEELFNTREYWLYELNEKIDNLRLIMARIREDE